MRVVIASATVVVARGGACRAGVERVGGMQGRDAGDQVGHRRLCRVGLASAVLDRACASWWHRLVSSSRVRPMGKGSAQAGGVIAQLPLDDGEIAAGGVALLGGAGEEPVDGVEDGAGTRRLAGEQGGAFQGTFHVDAQGALGVLDQAEVETLHQPQRHGARLEQHRWEGTQAFGQRRQGLLTRVRSRPDGERGGGLGPRRSGYPASGRPGGAPGGRCPGVSRAGGWRARRARRMVSDVPARQRWARRCATGGGCGRVVRCGARGGAISAG